MRELRWHLERFLDYPFHPETAHAGRVLDAVKAWGIQAFDALFDRRDAGEWLARSGIQQVRSDDPSILSWPWEALLDPQTTYLAHERRIERRLNKLRDPQPAADLPRDRPPSISFANTCAPGPATITFSTSTATAGTARARLPAPRCTTRDRRALSSSRTRKAGAVGQA